MKKMTAKIVSVALALLLALAACAPALAGGANRSIMHFNQNTDSSYAWISGAMEGEGGIWVFLNGNKNKVLFYPDGAEEPLEYVQPDQNTSAFTEDGASVSESTIGWFGWNGAAYELYFKNIYTPSMDEDTSGSNEVEGGLTRKLVIEDGKITSVESDIPQLDWSEMVEDYGDWKSSRYIYQLTLIGNRLAGTCWDNNGNQLMLAFDLTNGEMEEIELPNNDNSTFAMLDDHTMLFFRYEWGNNDVTLSLVRYDLAEESEETLSTVTKSMDTFGSIYGLCADAATNTLYYVQDGEIWAASGMDLSAAVAVNDCPVAYDVSVKVMKDGNLLVNGQNAVMIRDVDPSHRADYSLIAQDYVYTEPFNEATYDFSNGTGVPVIIRRGGVTSNILQDMMNRDDSVDIYTLYGSSSEFEALKNRGFLADLSGNEKLAAIADRLVPYIRDAVTKDGKLIAVPTNAYGNSLGYKPEILKKLGMEEDLPKTWNQFFDWLETLSAKMEGTEFTPFQSYMSKWEFRYSLLSIILNQYQLYISEGDREYAFNTPLLRGLLDRLSQIDCDALGLRDVDESEDGGMWSEEMYREALMETYTQTTMQTYSDGLVPLALSFEEGEDPILPVTINVAFVNPFSKHAEEASEFLALAMKNLDIQSRYTIYADETEPIRYPDFEEYKQNMQKWYEEAKNAYENAEDEEIKENWKQTVEDYEKTIADIDNTYWQVSPQSIADYQSRIGILRVMTYDISSSMISTSENETGYYELADNFAGGTVSAEDMLSFIDKKVQMMRLEGN